MPGVGRLSSPVLVGRDEQLARLTTAWEAGCQGRPSLVLVGGDAGVGKTRLVDTLAEHAREGKGARILFGACIDVGDGSVPFAPLTEALRRLARTEDAAQLPELLGPARRELARLVPALGGDGHSGEPPSPIVVLQAATDGLGRMSRSTPVLLVVEDIHWADRSTLDLLAYLARTLRDERLMVVATYRTDELHRRHPLLPFLGELSRAPIIERVDLAPFGRRELTEQLTAILDETPQAHLIDEILARSDGNPFVAEELLAARDAPGMAGLPVGLRDILDARVAGLPSGARRVLEVAATIGRTAHHSLLREVTGVAADELRSSLRAAVEHQVLVPDDEGRYRFRHALVQEAVHDELLPGERVELHREVAQALESDPSLASGGAEHVDAELAHHWDQAGERERAFDSAVRAARHAEGLPAYPEALSHYERALRLRSQVAVEIASTVSEYELLRGAVRCAVGVGDFRRALNHQRVLYELVAEDDAEGRARALRQLSHLHWYAGNGAEARTAIDEAVALVSEAPSSKVKGGVLAYAARLASLQGRPDEGVDLAEEAVRIAEEIGDDAERSSALNSRGLIRNRQGEQGAAVDDIRASVEAAKAADAPGLIATAYNNLLSISALKADDEQLGRLQAEIEDWIVDYEDHAGAAFLLGNLADASLRLGDVPGAAARLQRAARHRLDGAFRMNYLGVATTVATLLGDYETADRHTEELRQAAVGTPDPQTWAPLLINAAVREILRDEPRKALELLDELDERLADLPRPLEHVVPLSLRAWALSELALAGDEQARAATADALAETERFDAGRSEGTVLAGVVAFARAAATRLDGPAPDAWKAAAEAEVQPFYRALAQLHEAEARVLLAQGEQAATVLTEAFETADANGFADLRSRLVALARRARLDVDIPELAVRPGDLGLTPRETEVLALVAEGRTNREIGEELFITEKTASVHVSNILTKLGVDNRGEAAAVAHRRGLVPG